MVGLLYRLSFATAVMIASVVSSPASAACGAGSELANVFDLDASFSPISGELSVRGRLLLVADAERASVDLLLNKAMNIQRFDISREDVEIVIEDDIEISGQALPRTRRITLTFDEALSAGERLEIRLQYSGRLTNDDIELGRGAVSPDWTELKRPGFSGGSNL